MQRPNRPGRFYVTSPDTGSSCRHLFFDIFKCFIYLIYILILNIILIGEDFTRPDTPDVRILDGR